MAKKRSSFPVPPTRRDHARVKMEIIPEPTPGTASVLVGSMAPVIRGEGPADYVCGGCRTVLCEAIVPGQVQHLVFKCPGCGAFNRVNAPGVQ